MTSITTSGSTDSRQIEAKAQIEILEFLLQNLCDCELNDKGRLFIRLHIKRLKKRLNDTGST
jgi:hypothetical protein